MDAVRARRAVVASALAAALLTGACASAPGTSAGGSASVSSAGRAGLRVLSTKQLSPRMRDLTLSSPALGHQVPVRLLLPADYAGTRQRLPVILLLHGCCDDYTSWTRSTDLEALSARTEALIVMPDGGRVGFYSNWLHGPRWEDFHLRELRSLLTREYRASDVWAVAGNSMGGLGALDYAARRPDLIRAAASFSGVVDTRLSPSTSEGYRNLMSFEGADPDDVWGDPEADAATWKAHNPDDLAARLRATRLYVSVGSGRAGPHDAADPQASRTERSLRAENDAFARHLRSLGIRATVHRYDPGVHAWSYWQRELHRAWPMLTAATGAESR